MTNNSSHPSHPSHPSHLSHPSHPSHLSHPSQLSTIKWVGKHDGYADMIDQTLLPVRYERVKITDVPQMFNAIKRLVIRGAPAIGIAAAYSAVLSLQKLPNTEPLSKTLSHLKKDCEYLASSRPTAVNLSWALNRMQQVASECKATDTLTLKKRLLEEAHLIRQEDSQMCRAIGQNGADLIPQGSTVLTHCNAGGLATADYGTALAVMFTAHQQGKQFEVYADETRPLLQGARLTAWELQQANIKVTLICDNMAGHLMSQGKIDLVITGADRIAANGDTANKIGTYSLAVLAKAHNIPFYIAAPSSTFDLSIPDGSCIPIEQRDPREITHPGNLQIAPSDINVYNPAFDVTPHKYIRAIITEKGLIESPNTQNITDHLT